MSSPRRGKKYQQFEQALKKFHPESIAALYNDLGRHECKINRHPANAEWPLEFCIRKSYNKSAHYLISLGLPLEELNCGLETALRQKPATCNVELIKTLLKNGAYLTSFAYITHLVNNFRYKPEHRLVIIQNLISLPSNPKARYQTLGLFLHYCFEGSSEKLFHRNEHDYWEKHREDSDNLFSMTWYKTLKYLMTEGLDFDSYWDKDILDLYPRFESHLSLIPCIDPALLSIMVRFSTGSSFSKKVFVEYVNDLFNLSTSHLYTVRRQMMAQHLLNLLPLFYHTGAIDVCDSSLKMYPISQFRFWILTQTKIDSVRDQYLRYFASLKGQPRRLRDLSCLQVRLALRGPNILCSVRTLPNVPTLLQDMITLKRLDITQLL